MTIVLDDLRTEVRAHLGVDTDDMSNTVIELLLNRAYWGISERFPAKEKTANFSFSDGVRKYTCPSPYEAVKMIGVEHDTGKDHKRLTRITREWYETQYVNDTDAEGIPKEYFREGDDFIVHPTPDRTYPGIIRYDTIFSDLSDSNVTPEIPQVWHEILMYGAVWRGYDRLGDFVKSAEVLNRQVSLLNSLPTQQEKEETGGLTGVTVPEELFEIDRNSSRVPRQGRYNKF